MLTSKRNECCSTNKILLAFWKRRSEFIRKCKWQIQVSVIYLFYIVINIMFYAFQHRFLVHTIEAMHGHRFARISKMLDVETKCHRNGHINRGNDRILIWKTLKHWNIEESVMSQGFDVNFIRRFDSNNTSVMNKLNQHLFAADSFFPPFFTKR